MEFTIYRDLASISFIRCISPIPGTNAHAEGTGFSILTALEKCRSEIAERKLHLSLPDPTRVLGIAAHPAREAAQENAWNEVLETLLLERLRIDAFNGVPVRSLNQKFFFGKICDRFASIAIFPHAGSVVGVQSVSKNPLKAILKTWTECRNVRIYNPQPSALPGYTKANRLLGAETLSGVRFRISLANNAIAIPRVSMHHEFRNNRHIVYFIKENP